MWDPTNKLLDLGSKNMIILSDTPTIDGAKITFRKKVISANILALQ